MKLNISDSAITISVSLVLVPYCMTPNCRYLHDVYYKAVSFETSISIS